MKSKISEEHFKNFRESMMKSIKAKDAEVAAAKNEAQDAKNVKDALTNELEKQHKREQTLNTRNKSLLERIEATTAAATEAEGSGDNEVKAGGKWSILAAMTDTIRLRS